MNSLSFEQLDQVRQDTNELVPGYFINELNPLSSLENGLGNCFAKAMIAAGIIVVRHNIQPATFYSDRLHGTDRPSTNKPQDRVTKKNMAHISLLVPSTGANDAPRVLGVSFGRNLVTDDYRKIDKGEIRTFNDDAYVDAERGRIIATEETQEAGVVINDWREGGDAYLTKLDRDPVDFDLLIQKVIEKTGE